MTLMSLLLAFGVSMAEGRYEQRSLTLIDEENAISTAYLRTSYLSGGAQGALKELISKYLDQRIAFYLARTQIQEQDEIQRRTTEIQEELWSKGIALARESQPVLASQFFAVLNQMFDLRSRQEYAYTRTVPRSIILLLFLTSCAVSGLVGFSHGISKSRHLILSGLMLVVVAFTLFVTIDLDRPRKGFIQLDPQKLIELKHRIS